MKASISSTVRGTHVSSSIPLAVTAMSSSIRTCHREHVVTRDSQPGMRSTSGGGGSGSARQVSVCGADATPGRAAHGEHRHRGSCGAQSPGLRAPATLPGHTSPTVTRGRAAPREVVAPQGTQVVPLPRRVQQGRAERAAASVSSCCVTTRGQSVSPRRHKERQKERCPRNLPAAGPAQGVLGTGPAAS